MRRRTAHAGRSASHSPAEDDGVSLVELMIVVGLMSVVIAGAYFLFNAANTMSDATQARQVAADEARLAMDLVSRELRQAEEISDGAGVFTAAQARDCSFYADVDRDDTPELVRYRIVGTAMLRSVAQPTLSVPPYDYAAASAETTVARGIDSSWSGAAFTYYGDADPPTVVASGHYSDISAVALHVVDKATVSRSTVSVDVSTWVKIRSVHNSVN